MATMVLSNKSPRHARRHQLAKALKDHTEDMQDYEITHPGHRPDIKGEFAGVRVRFENGKQVVRLHPNQARFYLDQGVILPMFDA